ncbi:MAG: arylsulfotransferase family protein [Pseudomonadota bacterium]
MRALPLIALLALGCPIAPETAVPVDTAPDTAPDSTPDSGEDPIVGEISWRLHEDIASLVYVGWESEQATTAWVEFRRVDEAAWHSTPAREVEAGPVEFLLLGIPFATDFTFRAVLQAEEGTISSLEHRGTTGPLPEGLPLPQVHVADPEHWEPSGLYLLGSVDENTGGWVAGDFWRFIVDREGRVVWAQETPDHHWTTFQRVSLSGADLMWDEFTFWSNWDQGAGSMVHRSKIDGSEVEVTATPGGHHAWAELPDGVLAWGSATWGTEVLKVKPPGGEESVLWDCSAFSKEHGIVRTCQSNTLTWDAESDSFLYSFYTTNTLVQIDRQTGETLRVFGQEYGDYAFDPVESAFAWQHGAVFTDDRTLLLSTHTTDRPEEVERTVAREYQVDDETMTLREIWSFGADGELNANTAGEAHRLPNGNTLHNYGSYGRLREVTPDGKIVWDMDWRIDLPDDYDRLIGRTVFIEDLYAFAP